MKSFKIVPAIAEYSDFAALRRNKPRSHRPDSDQRIHYEPTIAALNLGCHTCFQEKFGGGEPTDIMVDAILDSLRGKKFDRIIAVGGGTIIDIAKVLAVVDSTDNVDSLYDNMSGLRKVHKLFIVPTPAAPVRK